MHIDGESSNEEDISHAKHSKHKRVKFQFSLYI